MEQGFVQKHIWLDFAGSSLEEYPTKNGEARTRHPETAEDNARVVEDAFNYAVALGGHDSGQSLTHRLALPLLTLLVLLLQVVENLSKSRQLLGVFLRDGKTEFLFKGQGQFDRIERVGTKIINEGGNGLCRVDLRHGLLDLRGDDDLVLLGDLERPLVRTALLLHVT